MGTQGKRAGSRRAAKKKSALRPGLLGLAAGVTLAVVAWGYLVYAAIDFGASARGGDQEAWYFLALASLGAVACLFIGLMLVSRLLRRLGITSAPAPAPPRPMPTVEDMPETRPLPRASDRPTGGRRRAG